MASAQAPKIVNILAGQDLRGDLFELLQVEDDGGVGKVIKTTAVTDVAIGVLAEDPDGAADSDGEMVAVALLHGVLKMKAGGTVTAGDIVVADTDAGRVVTVADIATLAADSMAVGVALETAADGEIFMCLAYPWMAHSA